jgi:GNAT superfamily N-acetyltransferase
MNKELKTKTELKRTNSDSADFGELIKGLDKELWETYPTVQGEYAPHNKVENLETVIVAYTDGRPVGCGCFKKVDDDTVEMKRVFVQSGARGNGIATTIMAGLEKWAKELNHKYAILETGILQKEAIHVYKKTGYIVTPNYEPYIGKEYSVCMKKMLQ